MVREIRESGLASSTEETISGAITGELYVFGGGSIKAAHKLHERPLDAITVTEQNVFTGGRDGIVNVLNAANYQVQFKFEIGAKYQSVNNPVRAIALHQNKSQLLIGT